MLLYIYAITKDSGRYSDPSYRTTESVRQQFGIGTYGTAYFHIARLLKREYIFSDVLKREKGAETRGGRPRNAFSLTTKGFREAKKELESVDAEASKIHIHFDLEPGSVIFSREWGQGIIGQHDRLFLNLKDLFTLSTGKTSRLGNATIDIQWPSDLLLVYICHERKKGNASLRRLLRRGTGESYDLTGIQYFIRKAGRPKKARLSESHLEDVLTLLKEDAEKLAMTCYPFMGEKPRLSIKLMSLSPEDFSAAVTRIMEQVLRDRQFARPAARIIAETRETIPQECVAKTLSILFDVLPKVNQKERENIISEGLSLLAQPRFGEFMINPTDLDSILSKLETVEDCPERISLLSFFIAHEEPMTHVDGLSREILRFTNSEDLNIKDAVGWAMPTILEKSDDKAIVRESIRYVFKALEDAEPNFCSPYVMECQAVLSKMSSSQQVEFISKLSNIVDGVGIDDTIDLVSDLLCSPDLSLRAKDRLVQFLEEIIPKCPIFFVTEIAFDLGDFLNETDIGIEKKRRLLNAYVERILTLDDRNLLECLEMLGFIDEEVTIIPTWATEKSLSELLERLSKIASIERGKHRLDKMKKRKRG